MATTFVGPVSAKSGQLREDWQHSDGKAHTRLADSWDDAEGVHKLAMLSWDTVGLTWVRFTPVGGVGGGGDASAANQVLELAKLTSIDGKTPALTGGRVPVDGSGVVQPVSGPLTDAQLRATPVPVSGTVATGGLSDAQLRAAAVPTSNAAATQADGHSATLGAKADAAWDLITAGPSSVSIWKKIAGLLDSIRVSVAGTLLTSTTQLPAALTGAGNLKVSIQEDGGAVISIDDNAGSLTVDASDVTFGATVTPKAASVWDISDRVGRVLGVIASITGALPAGTNLIGQAAVPPATLAVTAVSGANVAVTCTLPAVVGQFHYISRIIIERVATTAIVGSAVLTYTSTNLPGAWARTTGNAAPVGVQQKDVDESLGAELKSAAANTNTTIIAPAAGATGIVRITVYYRAGV